MSSGVVHGSQVTADHVGWNTSPKGMNFSALNLALLRGHAVT